MMTVAVTAGALGPQAAALADPSPNTRTILMYRYAIGSDALFFGTVDTDWQVGDCTMRAGSQVTVDPQSGWVVWDAVGSTSHTSNADIWHSRFTFHNYGTAILSTPEMDGARMTRIDRDYAWTASRTGLIPVPGDVYLTHVVWRSSC